MRAFFRNTVFGLVLVFMVSCGSTMEETTYKDTILNKSTIEFCQFISNTSVETQNYKALLESTKKAYPQLGNMLDITSVYFEGMELVTTEEEWQQYCKNVIKTISNSSIPSKDKDALKMGVTVGYASSKLWKSEYYYNI